MKCRMVTFDEGDQVFLCVSKKLQSLFTGKVQSVKDFLSDHMDMLRLARQNIRQAQDCFKKFADVKRRMVTFAESDQVFLRVPQKS